MSEEAPPAYDPVELRRRIAVCFSIGELRELAESLGVGAIPWERGLQESAREVVRQCERYAGLPALVAKLREVRPLVEWPEPAGASPAQTAQAAPNPAPQPVAPSVPPPGFPVPPQLGAVPGSLGPSPGSLGPAPAPAPAPAMAAPSEPPLRDPYAPPPGPAVIRAPAPAAAPPPPGAAWPGTVAAAPPPASRGIDPRLVAAAGGTFLVMAAVIAYLAGRASGSSDAPPASSAASVASVPRARGDGPAARVADAMAHSFANMARVCELPPAAGESAAVFRRVFERCGPAPPPRRIYSPPVPTDSASATAPADPDAPADPGPRTKRAPRGAGGDPPPAQAPGKGCLGACQSTQQACNQHCGPEPSEASAYDGYNRCVGRCLSDASRCKLSCR